MDIYLNTTSIHARPTSVRSMPSNGGCVTVAFEGWNELTFYCGDAEMALDMERAIRAVIERHKTPPLPEMPREPVDADEIPF